MLLPPSQTPPNPYIALPPSQTPPVLAGDDSPLQL